MIGRRVQWLHFDNAQLTSAERRAVRAAPPPPISHSMPTAHELFSLHRPLCCYVTRAVHSALRGLYYGPDDGWLQMLARASARFFGAFAAGARVTWRVTDLQLTAVSRRTPFFCDDRRIIGELRRRRAVAVDLLRRNGKTARTD
jgi:hypothetical protein